MESGYHTDFWMDLETLCLEPAALRPFVIQLADRLRPYRADIVCGALNEGAFVALMVADLSALEFAYAERFANPASRDLFPVRYRVPAALRQRVRRRRVAIVNDVISAGSAVRGVLDDLNACGAEPVAVAALMTVGDAFLRFARERAIAVEALSHTDVALWSPEDCPLCRAREIPLEAPTS